MSEDAIFILFMLFFATAAYAAYLRLWAVRRLQKKVDKLVDAAVAAQPQAAARLSAPTPEEQNELRRIRERLHVLERIAVEKEDSLSRSIEELRATDA